MSGWSARTDRERDRAGVAIGSGIGVKGGFVLAGCLVSSRRSLVRPCAVAVVAERRGVPMRVSGI